MKNLVVTAVIGGLFSSVSAFALHDLSCSNASTSMQIQEDEIWGANPVGCVYKGEQIENGKAVLNTKSLIKVEGDRGKARANWKATYTVKATFTRTDGHALTSAKDAPKSAEATLICQESSSSAMDLAPRTNHCSVEWK